MPSERVSSESTLRPGMRVEVATRFRGNWASGFEVDSLGARGYRLRRCSDGSLLPTEFALTRVRAAAER